MAYDPLTSQTVLFGGSSSTATDLNDTWTWNGTTWTRWTPAHVPPHTSPLTFGSESARLARTSWGASVGRSIRGRHGFKLSRTVSMAWGKWHGRPKPR
jgi:hypothetical protein